MGHVKLSGFIHNLLGPEMSQQVTDQGSPDMFTVVRSNSNKINKSKLKKRISAKALSATFNEQLTIRVSIGVFFLIKLGKILCSGQKRSP